MPIPKTLSPLYVRQEIFLGAFLEQEIVEHDHALSADQWRKVIQTLGSRWPHDGSGDGASNVRFGSLEQLSKPQPFHGGRHREPIDVLTVPFAVPDAHGQPQKERDWLVTVPQSDGSLIFLIFVSPQSDFTRFQPMYAAMLKSAQFK